MEAIRTKTVPFGIIFLVGSALGAAPALAVIVDGAGGNNSVPQPASPVAGLNNVGSIPSIFQVVPNASGVYLGNGWVITAQHLGAISSGVNFVLNGNTFTSDGLDDRIGTTDLQMFHLQVPNQTVANELSAIPSLNIASATPTVGATFYTKGFGSTRSSMVYYEVTSQTSGSPSTTTYTWTPSSSSGTFNAEGYSEINTHVLWYGANAASDTTATDSSLVNFNDGSGKTNIFVSEFLPNGGAQLSGGDSGGGVFDLNNNLIGINLVDFTHDANQPANTAIYGNESGYADLSAYRTQILAIRATPEPGTVGLIGFLAPLLLRRKRSV